MDQPHHGCLVKDYSIGNVFRLPQIRLNKRVVGEAENPAQNIFMWTRTSFDLDQVEISSSSLGTRTHFWIRKDDFHTCLWKMLPQESRVPGRNLSNSESPSKERVTLAGWEVLGLLEIKGEEVIALCQNFTATTAGKKKKKCSSVPQNLLLVVGWGYHETDL